MTSTTPMIRMAGVDKHFGELHVLRDINLEVDTGQVVVVLGPSGSGKSTLCRTINRLEPIDSGHHRGGRQDAARRGQGAGRAARRRRAWCSRASTCSRTRRSCENVTLAPLKVRKDQEGRSREGGTGAAGAGRHRQPAGQVPGPALRRAAAAGGHRPGAGHEAQGDAVRRAHLGAGPGDGPGGPGRDDHAGQGGHDHARGHPRDGLRPPRRQPRGVHVRRRDRRGRHARRSSSPTPGRTGPRTSWARY